MPKVQAFCEHYGTVILPTKPYTPEHKGKVEAGVKYVKHNGLKGRTFTTLAEQQHLQQWESSVADRRIHGTTKQQVAKVFETSERPALLPLPLESFSNFHEAQRKVNRDGHVEVAKAYYSASPEYLDRTVPDEHHIIRPLDDYARVVTAAIQRQDRRSSLSESFTRHDSGV
ncbi:MAG: hypothetical protein JNM18_22715 [Planctomycetaceae bacterium]|nr:hypothetical protein [Planctomycetaceae bacterium]